MGDGDDSATSSIKGAANWALTKKQLPRIDGLLPMLDSNLHGGL